MYYDDLVKRLKYKAGWDESGDLEEAADAIEELQADKAALNGTVANLLEQIKGLGKPHWIPKSERLPDGRDSVLALTGDCDIYVCDYIPSVKQFWTIPGDELHIDDITHWQPLPQPPKEEGE